MSIDISDIDKCKEDIKSEVKDILSQVAKEGVAFAKEYGSYQNHTHNLRNAVGTAVIVDGKVEEIYIPSAPGHEEAREKTKALIESENTLENGIVIADGMEYASFVESKGYDVISGGALHIAAKGESFNNKK